MLDLLTNVLLAGAAGMTLAWFVAAQRRLVVCAARRFLSLPRLQQVVLVLAVCISTVCAQKTVTNENAIIELSNNRIIESAEAEASNVLPAALNTEGTEVGRHGEEVGRDVLGTPLTQETSAISNTSVLRAETTLASSANLCESVQSEVNAESESLSNHTCSLFTVHCSLSTNDLSRGFALTRVGTNEVFDFSAPEGANYATNWMLHGGATARTRLRFDDWTFPFGDGCLTNLTAFMFGVIAPDLYNEEMRIAPLQASIGFIAGGLREIIELSNNRIIESAEASASDSNDSRKAAENAEEKMAAPQAEEESLSNHNSIIRTFDYSIIDSTTSATSDTSVLRAKTTLTSSANPCQFVQSVAQGTEQESLSNRNSIIRTFDYSIIVPSSFWSILTPSNSLVITWQNVLLHRLPANPVSFQVESFANGDFTYRYDFSQLPSDAVLTNAYVIAAPGVGEPFVLSRDEPFEDPGFVTNVVQIVRTNETTTADGEVVSEVVVSNQIVRLWPSLNRNLTSLTFRRLEHSDRPGADRDGDGLTTEEELFVYGTNPGLADTSGDGVSDGEAVAQGLDPLARHISDTNVLARVAASATNAAFASATTIAEGSLASWTLFDGFAANVAAGSTNVVWERTFAVDRTSAWQQFFVSSEKNAAGAWMLEGLRLEWEASDGSSGSQSRSPVGDSFRIPLSTNEVSTITLRLRATGTASVRSAPLYLLAYAPTFEVNGGRTIAGESGATSYVTTDGAGAAFQLVIDSARRPHKAAIGADEQDWGAFDGIGSGFSFEGRTAQGATLTATRPGEYSLPSVAVDVASASPRRVVRRAAAKSGTNGGGRRIIVLDPGVGWECRHHGCERYELEYDWDTASYSETSGYPLDTKCLRKKWYRNWDGSWYDGYCNFYVRSGVADGVVTTKGGDGKGAVYVDGVEVWLGSAVHVYDSDGCGDVPDRLSDECGDCDSDCADGDCDSQEGSALGSLRFRIPLGSPGKGLVAGFAWFASEGPVVISRSLFQVKAHPDATITNSTASGVRHIVCSDAQGRDLAIEDIANGVRVTIRTTNDQTLEHTWEIMNVDGDSSRVRLKKISRRGNVMSDETYAHADGTWTRTDNVAATTTELVTEDNLASGGTKRETRTTTDADGNLLEYVVTEQSRVGSYEHAVLRETYREELGATGNRETRADYWDDASSQRHGKLRLMTSNARAWEYHDYDGDGRETLRVTQRNGAAVPSAFPNVVSNELQNAQGLSDAFVTVFGYEPMDGDDLATNDYNHARMETEFVVRDGVATAIGKKWRRYTRLTTQGYDAIKCETWRAASANAAFGDAANAYSYEITFADTGDGTPRLMRGATAEALDEDGIKTANSYSLNGSVLVCETRKAYGDGAALFPTYETTETEATEGTLIRRTTRLTSNGAIIADARSTYDEKRRLRSTTYLDGTSLTNAYSCCRLLWSVDREGRKTLRSAETGTDHLYYADEDVWLADVSTNCAYRVTQHFFDALGRETNTVVSVGVTPGEATTSTWRSPFAASDASSADPGSSSLASLSSLVSISSTRYPYGGSDYSISTDARGTETVRRVDLIPSGEETCEAIFTNGVEVSRTKSRSIFGGATSTRREWGISVGQTEACENWTEQTRFSDYDSFGRRVEYAITTSSDYGAVMNSVSTYDLLDRLVSTATPLGTTAYEYDGVTSRISQSVFTAGDVRRVTAYLYNAQGELVGTTTDGVTTRSDVAYETDASNISWRVTTDSVLGARTNDWTITREQLTGLTNGLRSCVTTETKRGVRTCTTKVCDATSGITTETRTSSDGATVVSRSRFGLEVERETDNVTRSFSIDPFGRSVREERTVGDGASRQFVSSHGYRANGDLLSVSVFTNDSDAATTRYEYDAFGQCVLTVDALGQETRTDYDAVGNVVAESGVVYPIRRAYDTAGHCTLLATTRDGETWDETRWVYDAVTGLCTTKIYADGSQVAYSYTPDGLLLRTTYASGRWIETVYDSRRQVVGRISSNGSDDASFERDEFGRLVALSNASSSVALLLSDVGMATNEIWTADDSSFVLNRDYDEQSRLARLAIAGADYAQFFIYADDGRIASISNDDAVVSYSYAPDRQATGYTIRLANDNCFKRIVERDIYRRELVTSISNIFNGVAIDFLAYSHDALNRPVSRNSDLFSYNVRGEVSSAQIFGFLETHTYDDIGNSTLAATFSETNAYTANSLNQYSFILRDFVSPCETITPTYDRDGNLTSLPPFSYVYDAASRLVSISSNNALLASYAYDAQGRRVRKTTPAATTTFFYDDWNLVEERIAYTNGTSSTIHYYWGKDLSGSLQGAGGIGGLLYLKIDDAIFIPLYDANGNITKYLDVNGNVVASYVYDAFGRVLAKSGALANIFAFRFSTKYHDAESGLYYYDKRFYSPTLHRWLTRDPTEERGGLNLYTFCKNNPLANLDPDGCAYFAVRRLSAMPAMVRWSAVVCPFDSLMGGLKSQIIDTLADWLNVEILHEQLFFEDEGSPSSIGWGTDSNGNAQYLKNEQIRGYRKRDGGYNDCVMRMAVQRVNPSHYQLLWLGSRTKCNCQDYAQALRRKYYELLNDLSVKCKCLKGEK
jgi:RHS repeat-associated protein